MYLVNHIEKKKFSLINIGKGILDGSGRFSFLNDMNLDIMQRGKKTHLMVYRSLIRFLIYVSL